MFVLAFFTFFSISHLYGQQKHKDDGVQNEYLVDVGRLYFMIWFKDLTQSSKTCIPPYKPLTI